MVKKSGYYNEIGIKISSLRLSIRFPCAPGMAKKPTEEQDYDFVHQHLNEYKSDWTWVPVKPTMDRHLLTMRPLPPPPVPPRSPVSAPTDILPPYPSSTVQRKTRISSYV